MMLNSDRVILNCNCRKGCTTNRYNRHKNSKKCGQNCHDNDVDCGNVAERVINLINKPIISIRSDDDEEITDGEAELTVTTGRDVRVVMILEEVREEYNSVIITEE